MLNLDTFNSIKSAAETNTRIFTPKKIVKEMLDALPLEIWNSHTVFLDPAVKSGIFLVELFNRLMESPSLIKDFPDQQARKDHILKNQIIGIAIDKLSCLTAQRNLYGFINPNSNIRTIEKYMELVKNKDPRFYVEAVKKEFNNMQFDVVIGNPPYQDEESRGSVGSGNAIYPSFMQKAMDLSNKYTSLIVPSGWMLQYPSGAKHELIDNIRKSSLFVELHDFKNSQEIFDNVNIPNGVCYYLTDKNNKDGLTDFYICQNGDKELLPKIKLYHTNIGVIFRDKAIINISEKIDAIHKEEKRFNEVCAGAKHHFDVGEVMESNWDEYSSVKTDNCNIMYFLKSNNKVHKYSCIECPKSSIPNLGYGWVSKEQIPKNMSDYKRHKIIVGQAFTAGSLQVMDIPQYIGNNSVCSHSYVPIFSPNDSEEECLNICKYIKTKFFRYLVNCMKTGQNLGNRTYSLVPMQNFKNTSDIDWSKSIAEIDQQLYKKYNFTNEEIAYIEATIKPM